MEKQGKSLGFCKNCNAQINFTTTHCPFCEKPLFSPLPWKKIKKISVIIFLLWIAVSAISFIIENNKKREIKRINHEYFMNNKNNIISNIENEIRSKNFEGAIIIAKKYEDIEDPKLTNLIQQSNEGILELERLKQKHEEDRHKKYQELVSKFGDGGINVNALVRTYIQRVANDPDSIEFVDFSNVFYNDSGWVVRCEFRGNNILGAKVRNIKWFTVQNRMIVDVQDSAPGTLNTLTP